MFIFRPVARSVLRPMTYLFPSGANMGTFDGKTAATLGILSPAGTVASAAIGSNVYIFGSYGVRRFTGAAITSALATFSDTDTDEMGAATLGASSFIVGGRTSTSVYSSIIRLWDGTTRSNAGFSLAAGIASMGVTSDGTAVFTFGGTLTASTYTNAIQRMDGSGCSTESATIHTNGGDGNAGYLATTSKMYFTRKNNGDRFISYDGTTVEQISTAFLPVSDRNNWSSTPAALYSMGQTGVVVRYDGTSSFTESANIGVYGSSRTACYSNSYSITQE